MYIRTRLFVGYVCISLYTIHYSSSLHCVHITNKIIQKHGKVSLFQTDNVLIDHDAQKCVMKVITMRTSYLPVT